MLFSTFFNKYQCKPETAYGPAVFDQLSGGRKSVEDTQSLCLSGTRHSTHIYLRPCHHIQLQSCLGNTIEPSIHVSNYKAINTENKRIRYCVQQLSPSQMDYKTHWTDWIRMSVS